MSQFFQRLNFINECRKSRLKLWECPPFLFIVMGFINIITVITVYLFAERLVAEPQIAALIVIFTSLLIFIVGSLLITGFNRIAEANRIKSEFVSLVSHQLRAPISVFKWTLELFEREPMGSGQRKEYLSFLTENSERMTRLVNLLLDVSRIEAGRFTLRRAPVSLIQLTSQVVDFLKSRNEKRVPIKLDGRSAKEVLGDAEHLSMVIQNLIDNAVRYSTGRGTIKIVVSDVGHDKLEWKISDQGVGIPAYQQKYIFQKFFRADNGQAREPQGTGLGLYIARAIINELGGEIGFESQEGKGSTFWFRLPMYK